MSSFPATSKISNMGMVAGGEKCGSEVLHILAVDDSKIDRMLVERLLKNSSYRVTTVDSGKRALEVLGEGKENDNDNDKEEQKVNMIITDYCMPEMTGFDLLKRVKESSTLRQIPVVIMSSENVPTRISRCLEEGAEEFILKPLRKSDVPKLHHYMMLKMSNQVHGYVS